jgi:hypothetical protein
MRHDKRHKDATFRVALSSGHKFKSCRARQRDQALSRNRGPGLQRAVRRMVHSDERDLSGLSSGPLLSRRQ